MSQYHVTMNGEQHVISVDDRMIRFDGDEVSLDVQRLDANTFSVLADGMSTKLLARRNGNKYQVLIDACQLDVLVESERDVLMRTSVPSGLKQDTKFEVRAPMPALVVKVEVSSGEEVHAGTGLVILEAMKMENEIRAHHSARVKQVLVANGKTVEKGELLMVLE